MINFLMKFGHGVISVVEFTVEEYTNHPRLESILSLDFNNHGKTLYYSIFYPFCYTVGGSHLLYIEGFQYRGKMDIIYTKLWENLDRVSIFIQKK